MFLSRPKSKSNKVLKMCIHNIYYMRICYLSQNLFLKANNYHYIAPQRKICACKCPWTIIKRKHNQALLRCNISQAKLIRWPMIRSSIHYNNVFTYEHARSFNKNNNKLCFIYCVYIFFQTLIEKFIHMRDLSEGKHLLGLFAKKLFV